ncbi:MAG: hypothetical protein H0V88_12935 [Pyrinomonadaceae bacterium]|nr:hypothetical protein [Pyrinomonadaceae bacterium]
MKRKQLFVRNFSAGLYLESFLVAAVASVLIIRLFLQLTGYPQIGGGGLHIAHMLWGGLLMLASIIVLLSFLGKWAAQLAAILGGTGFGAFIDEVGKFVTSNNDYFFQPAVAMIYVIFILIFIAIRALQRGATYSREEYLANALREIEEAALHDLDAEERKRALFYLEKTTPDDALALPLRSALAEADLIPHSQAQLLDRIKNLIKSFYHYVARLWWFPFFVIGFFIVQLVLKLIYVFILIFFVGLGWNEILDVQVVGRIAARMKNLHFVDWAEIVSSLLSGAFVLWGVMQMRRSRLSSYRAFKRSVLVSIFFTQVFAFYQEQFSALLGLLLNIAILVALQFMIDREESAVAAAKK